MVTQKVSLTLDQKIVSEARRWAGKRGLSAFVNDALKAKLQHERIGAWLEEAERESGPIPEEIQRQVDKEWDAAFPPSRRKRRPSSSTRAR